MAVKFAGTMNAINRGLDETKPAKGATMIEDWEAALADTDVPGAKGILRDLASLRKQLERMTPTATASTTCSTASAPPRPRSPRNRTSSRTSCARWAKP